jgi:hypothetical protein
MARDISTSDKNFIAYSKKLSEANDDIPLQHAIKSNHKGLPRWRDRIVFMKMALIESLSYFSIILALITFTALTPQAIKNANGLFNYLGFDYQLPVNFASIITVVVIAFVFAFGIIAYRFFGLAKSANEIGNRYAPMNYLMFRELQEFKEILKENTKTIEELQRNQVIK